MHMVIVAIVYASSDKEALDKAKEVFEGMTGDKGPFDYYETFDGPGTRVSGRGRYGSVTPVSLVTSKEGKKLVDVAWKATERDTKKALSIVRKWLPKFTDDELLEGDVNKGKKNPKMEPFMDRLDGDMLRYFMLQIGEYKGPNVWLYDDDGEGIRDKKHLKRALNKWKCLYEDKGSPNPNSNLDVYAVPADVHH